MTRKRLAHVLLFGFSLLAYSGLQSDAVWAQQTWTPTLQQVQQIFPGSKATSDTLGRFKGMKVDLNGDGKKEWVLVENPNRQKKASNVQKRLPNQCPCPVPKVKGKIKRIRRMLRSFKASLYNVERLKVRKRRYDLRIWLNSTKSKSTSLEKWATHACKRLARHNRRLRRYRIKRILFVSMEKGTTLRISLRRCVQLKRYRKMRYALRRFKRWSQKVAPTTLPMCPCSKKAKKKKKRIALPTASQPLKIAVAVEKKTQVKALPGAAVGSLAQAAPQLNVIGRLRSDSIRFVPLTQTGKILGIRIERTHQLGPRLPRRTTEFLYIYDEGNSGRLKQVFKVETMLEGDDKEPGARRWVDIKFRQLDSDAWMEITADTYYETPRFNGLIGRRMFKWHQGRYVPLNQHRGILRARANSTWKRTATKGSRMLRKRLQARTQSSNVVDGFKNTPWVTQKLKRGMGSWVRVDLVRTMPVLGVAVAAKLSKQFKFIEPKLYSGPRILLFAPRYIRVRTSSGFKQTAVVRTGGGYTFLRFPTPVQTRYIEVSIVAEHRSNGRTQRMTLPSKEKAVGLISEIVPIVDQIRYTASSFESKNDTMTARNAGDHRSTTAWAEGRTDNGIGEWLQMVFPMPRTLQSITFVNGCRRPGERYILNNRVKEAQLTFSNGTVQTVRLKDSHGPQKVKLNGIRTMSVMLTIRSIYKGKLGHTTCIAEMRP